MQTDLSNKEDIKILIDLFYAEILENRSISHFFKDHMSMSLEDHLPTMYSFWESMVLDQTSYKGNPMLKHIELNRKSPILKEHFDAWIQQWERTIHDNFSGPNATKAIEKAKSIRSLMEFKINQQNDDFTRTK